MPGFISNVMYIKPAYGRVYKTQAEAVADFDAGKDFKIEAGPYMSKRDVSAMKAEGYTTIVILRPDGRKHCIIEL